MKFLVEAPSKERGKEATAKETTLAELPDESREQVKAMIDNSRAQMHAGVQFIAMETTDLQAEDGPSRRRSCRKRCGRVSAAR